MDNPLYLHDCAECNYLGTVKQHDLYYCSKGYKPTVIARNSSEAADYLSGMRFAIDDIMEGKNTPLATALKRAYKRGLVKLNAVSM